MATKTDPITPELKAAALRVVASLNEVPAGFVPAVPGPRPEVGQVVSCWGHNKQRVGVITEVTKTRVHVLFTTPGAITEAQNITAHYQARSTDLASYIAAHRETATSNYLYTMAESRLETAKHGRNYKGDIDTDHLVRHADHLAEIEAEGFEARLTRIAQASLDQILRNKQLAWADRVGYTHSWKKLSEVYVLPEG